MSFAQQRLWFLDQLETNRSAYNLPGVLRLTGSLDIAALKQSFDEVVRRHESLRTSFVAVDGKPLQIISEPWSIVMPLLDLSHLPEPERAREAQRLAREEAQRPFDLSRGPLLRATLLKLNADEHVLLFTMHHIIGDGWSAGVLIREVATLYAAYLRGDTSPLAELAIQYADYAVWQREWLQGEVLEEQLEYWREQLRGAPAVLELPRDHARPVVQSYRGAVQSFALSHELSEQLKELSRREGATLFMTLLAAFQILLYRYTNQTDIVVGTPIAGRTRAETEKLIGFFVNTLALRTDLSGAPTFTELLRRVREVALGAYAHQDIPFEKLVEELQPERSLSHAPLFQVMFNLLNHNDVDDLIKFPSLTVETTSRLESSLSKFDLTLYALERNGKIEFDLVSNSDLFEPARMVEMSGQFRLLLSQIVENPDENIDSLALVTPEAEPLLPNPTQELDFTWEGAVHTRFSEQARRVPDRLAVKDKDDAWNYRELELRSNQLANYLLAGGIKSQDIVAVYSQRSASLVWALLGVLKAGAAFLILDSSYPAARLISCLRAAKPQGFLQIDVVPDALEEYLSATSFRCRLQLPPRSSLTACDPLTEYSTDDPGLAVGPDDLAYITFTSGSTGTPKGVLGTHGPVSHFIQWHRETFKLDESDRFSMLSGLAHDPLLRDLFTPLCLGATLCIPDSEQMMLPTQLAEWMAKEKISITHLTPAMGQILTGTTTQISLPFLRYAFYGAEALTKRDVINLQKLAPSATCVNFYGATETPQAVGYFIASNQEENDSLPIGHGIKDVQLLVLNACQRLAGIGEAGEIYVRSPYLAKGYVGDRELTRERFIINPFTRRAGDYLYRTGDLARYSLNGRVEFLGRIDQQVNVRGYRVELGEIEAVLGEHPAVRKTVVVAREDESEEKRLVAYLVPHAAETAGVTELRSYLKEKLPDYMVPSWFVLLDKLPLTANGKVNRRALPAPAQSGTELAAGYVAPQTAVEEIVANIWSEVLQVERVGIHDNFFEIGGHSLLATQVISRVREAFRVELPLRSLFERATVAGLAERIEEGGRGKLLPAIEKVSRAEPLPLSFAQQRLWFLDQLEPESAVYNVPAAVRLEGELNVNALQQTLTEVVRRHEVLRTTFSVVNGEPVQVIGKAAAVNLTLVDLSQLAEPEREAQRLAREEAERPFDLARGLLLRASLLKLKADEHVLLFTMHHIISDGWSIGVLVREVSALYAALARGAGSPLAELAIQYADYAVWQREWLQGAVLEEQLGYWREQLQGAPAVLELPSDHARPVVQSYRGAMQSFALGHELSEQLKGLSRREGATLFMTLLAAFQVLLYRYTNQTDIVVGTPIAGRTRAETENLIGFFVNTLALRTDLSGGLRFVELLRRVREVALGAYAHQDIPFEKLVEELQPERSLSHAPLFQVMMVLQNAPAPMLELGQLRVSSVEMIGRATKFDLTLELWESSQELRGRFEYKADLFDESSMARMADHLQVLLKAIVANPEQRIEEPVLTTAEREQLLLLADQTRADYPKDTLIHQLFESQVELTPDAVAITFEDKQLSYRELNARANQLAHHLREQGIGPEMLVGICLGPSIEMVVGLVGILKAGAAYVPLDP